MTAENPPLEAALRDRLRAALKDAWRASRPIVVGRVDHLDLALAEGLLVGDVRHMCAQEAHKLAGALGSFGSPDGSALAREAEHILDAAPGTDDVKLLALVGALRRAIAHLDETPEPPASAP